MSGALGDVCPPCYISAGGTCEICPDDAVDFPECRGCVNGTRPSVTEAFRQSLFFPILGGVATTLLATFLAQRLFRSKN
jgi:hypothetical protein